MSIWTIEKLLHWAFVEQMPTPAQGAEMAVGGFGPWGAIEQFGALGTLVDVSRSDGGGMCWVVGAVDADAVAVVNAVAGLDSLTVREDDSHDLLAGWSGLGALGDELVAKAWAIVSTRMADDRVALKAPLSALVRRMAVLGQWPVWQCDAPRVAVAEREGKPAWFRKVQQEVEWNTKGKPTRWVEVEVDGRNKVTRRPYEGAYRKFVLTPDVSGALARRIEYSLTHAALTTLAEELDGIGGRKVLPPMCPAMPWAPSTESICVGA